MLEFKKFAIIPALATMLDQNENFDEKAQRKLVQKLLEKKVDGFYIGGATGEGFLLNPEERKKVISVSLEEINGRVPAIAYTGSNDLKTAVDISRFAQSEGADAISSVRPYYGAFPAYMIQEYYERLSQSVSIPLVIYNNANAQLSGLDEIVTLCNIKNCCGIKYTLPNHFEMRLLKDRIPGKFVFSGVDEMFASAMVSGVDGAIGSTYNLAPDLFMQLRTAFETGDMASFVRWNQIDAELVKTMMGYTYLGSMKYLISYLGTGTRTLRCPNHTLRDEEAASLLNDLRKLKAQYEITGVELFDTL